MNEFIRKMERKFGRYAISNLTIYIIGLYVVGYVLALFMSPTDFQALYLDPYKILHGQIWRLISWVIVPASKFDPLMIITLIFYYFIGTNMERTMGTFRYNFYIFSGLILMIVAAFLTMGIYYVAAPSDVADIMEAVSGYFNMLYLQETVFLAFAICYPEMQVLLMFIIPVKVKWMGIAYGVILLVTAIQGLVHLNFAIFLAIASQLLNLFLFYLQTGRLSRYKPKDVKRRRDFSRNVKMAPRGITRHKCAVCGRTEETNPELEFRFCSKCNGNYEYCQEHLFTHQHVQ